MSSLYQTLRHEILGNGQYASFFRLFILSLNNANYSISMTDILHLDDAAFNHVMDLGRLFRETGLSDPEFQDLYAACYEYEMQMTLAVINKIVLDDCESLCSVLEHSDRRSCSCKT